VIMVPLGTRRQSARNKIIAASGARQQTAL
jgi:hypothetical protein